MQILLLKDTPKVGKKGEIVKVSDGYARNFIIPKGYGIEAREGELKHYNDQKASEQKKKDNQKKRNEELIESLKQHTFEVKSKSGESGKLFGSITAADLAEVISKKAEIEFDKTWFDEKINIKELGNYKIKIKLSQGVRGEISLKVLPL